MTSTYEQVSGTTPDPDEQHEPRTVVRNDPERGLLMMSEIGDGVFVEWGTCAACRKRIAECTHADGPQEPEHIARWRAERFAESFALRGVEPPLSPVLKTRDRQLDAAIRELQKRGYTIEAPTPFEVVDEVVATATEDDIEFARETLGEDATDDEVENLAEQRAERDAKELDREAVSEAVENGLTSAIDRVRQRAQEDDYDPGF